MVDLDSVFERLRSYDPTLNKILFGLSLLGVVVVSHLAIQQGREFDRGCLGFSGLDAGQMAFDCSAVVSSGAGTFLGLSNITWGLGFYLGIAVLTFAIFQVGSPWRTWLHATRLSGLLGGLLYSGYLVYVQVGVLNALCALCLMSAGLAALLFVVQGTLLLIDDQSTQTTMTSRLFRRDLTAYVYLAAFTAVLVGADVTYFNTLSPAAEERSQAGDAACQLDSEAEPVENDGAPLVGFQDVTKGPSDAPVTVIEYFDPNCPHCKDFHQTVKKLLSEYEDEVRFVYKPFPLRRGSIPEIQALYIANQENKFSEMLDAQYERQSRSGISKRDLRSIASEIGMNPDVLISRIDQNKYRKKIVTQYKKAREIGVSSTPTVLINGHFVESRTPECMRTFIDRAKEGKLASNASSS